MKYVKLGKSNLKVSKVCMGCMGFGNPENGMHSWTLPEKESKEIIEYGIEKGINFTLGCDGSRKAADIKDNEMTIGISKEQIDTVVNGLESI